jgi:uncharacterized protein (TIGR02246 family)
MKFFKKWLGLFVLSFYALSAFAQNAVPIEAVGQEWAVDLSSGNPQKISDLYAPGAILSATFENQLDNPKAIQKYFTKLMQHKDLAVKFNKQNIRMFGNAAINSGFYMFSYKDKDNKTIEIPARYTFVYAKEDGNWKIVEHHSSVLPE